MDDEHLQEMYEMVKENNSILRGMHRGALVKGFLKFLFWAVVLVVLYLGWMNYVQPTLNEASQAYQSTQSQIHSTQQSLQGIDQEASSTESFFGGILKNFGL